MIRELFLTLALWPYYLILTVARYLPLSLGGLKVPTDRPDWKVFFIYCFPLTLLQLNLAFFFLPLVLWDYSSYKHDIGENGKDLKDTPGHGIHHGVTTYLYTRYLENPLVKPDVCFIDHELRAAAEKSPECYLPPIFPHREAPSRPLMLEGIPQRQLTQLPSENEIKHLNDLVFNKLFKDNNDIVIGRSLLEGTGAHGLRWKPSEKARPELESIKQEFAHQHSVDKSWHVLLPARDAIEVIEKGWGERGPPHIAQGMGPPGLVLIYAPRNHEERMIFMKILTASTLFCAGTSDTREKVQ